MKTHHTLVLMLYMMHLYLTPFSCAITLIVTHAVVFGKELMNFAPKAAIAAIWEHQY